ncbi:hypothetical protein Pmar_PMAR002687, partial [Perkinsus marinus ATCC 50983]
MSVVDEQISEPSVEPLSIDHDEADLFNSKNDFLDTKSFLTDPDLQPIFSHSAGQESKSHMAEHTVAPRQQATMDSTVTPTPAAGVDEGSQTGRLQ